MTVSTIIPVNNYTGNNSVTIFDFDFLIQRQEELEVSLTDENGIISILSLGIDYSIGEIGNENGSYITFPLEGSSYGVLTPEETITLSLILPIKQESKFENSANLDLNILEHTFDYIVRVLQILNRKIDRCVKTNEGIDISPDSLLEQININAKTAVLSASNALASAAEASVIKDIVIEKEQNMQKEINSFEELCENTINDILDLGIETRSKTDLSNITSEAEKHFINKTQVTNCLLEIPQKIKYELSDGILTIKAGTILIVPYGKENLTQTYPMGSTFLNENFKVVDTQYSNSLFFVWVEVLSDISAGVNGYSYTGFSCVNLTSNMLSTDTATINTDYSGDAFYYNSTDNLLQWVGTTGNTTSIYSLPVCISTLDSSDGYISVDKVFNGIGYIGKTIWCDKGVKGLTPNGRNFDGTLNNIESTNSKFVIQQCGTGTTNYYWMLALDGSFGRNASVVTHFVQNSTPSVSSTYATWYHPDKNIMFCTNDTGATWIAKNWTIVCEYSLSNDVVTDCSIQNTFRAVNYDDLSSRNFIENILSLEAPDVSTRISASSGYTTKYECFAYASYGSQNASNTLSFDGISVYNSQSGSSYVAKSAYIRCPKGVTITGNFHSLSIDALKGVVK